MGMREYSSKKVNVLGIDVSVMRPEKAVNQTMEHLRTKGLKTIFFLSAEASLFCQNEPWAMECVQNCSLVLTGDRNTEMAVLHRHDDAGNADGIGKFADEYLKRLFSKLNRSHREIYAVMGKQEHFDALREYMENAYPDIYVNGIVYEGETAGEPDKVVNEINAIIPDVVFFCLSVDKQLMFMKEYASMMNTRLCIGIDSLQPLIQKETGSAPSLIRLLHLEHLWYYLTEESYVRKTIAGSVFKKKVLGNTSSDQEQDSQSGETPSDEQEKETEEKVVSGEENRKDIPF